MSGEKIDYAAIIADLEAKRATIDTAIASLRALSGLEPIGVPDGVVATTSMPFAASGAGEIPDGSFHGKSIPEGIRVYLELMRKKQTAREIAEGLKKGGMESKSKFFEKIVYATLDRLKKTREVVKIRSEWGLPQWYPALMRASISDNGQPSKWLRTAGSRKDQKTIARRIREMSKEGPSSSINRFLKESPGPHSSEEIQSSSGIKSIQVVTMLLGQLAKKGEVEKTADGKYRKI